MNGPAARLVPLFDRVERSFYLLGTVLWLAAIVFFWSWWLRPENVAWWPGYVALTLVFAWIMLVPFYFIAIFFGAKRVKGALALPPGSRVAIIVTKAPGEPVELLKTTLTAMLRQDVPHDTWIADEDPCPEMVSWCRDHGVQISSRKGVEAYHQKSWPRRTRCKEGNLAYFYDQFGYERYDFVAQLDADHVPEPGYLREILKPFGDPEVGYVSAPSICDANMRESWAARSRLYHEAPWHGAQQIGYNNGWAPICIGSHYAVRTKALKDIGGLGPELAEDHSTTLLFNAAGWKGVHAIDAIAHGDGPRTFADLATQEFQWARSLVMILLQYTPTYLRTLSPWQKFQFLFCQLWYPLSASVMLAMFLMPIVALSLGVTFANVTFPDFVLHYAPSGLILTVMLFFWRRKRVFRPAGAPIISWEAATYLIVKWPWALAGCIAAVRDHVTGTFVDFRVTPKGSGPATALPMRVLTPYAVLAAGSAMPALLIAEAGRASGFYIFAIVNAVVYGGVLGLIVWRHARESGLSLDVSGPGLAFTRQAALALVLLSLPAGAAALRGAEGWEAVTWGLEDLPVVRSLEQPAVPAEGNDDRQPALEEPTPSDLLVSSAPAAGSRTNKESIE